jgi:SAM-dependent methyltransferase
MGLEFHQDKTRYFNMQRENAARYVIPFVEEAFRLNPDMTVLEIGCAEGGVLLAFIETGMQGVGVELQEYRAGLARGFLADQIQSGRADIISNNIYDPVFAEQFKGKFDLIVLKDVIEHIPEQDRVLAQMKQYLRPGGHIFFGFPPWQMPFGGHQQICRSKVGKLPWMHLLPRGAYEWYLRKAGEPDAVVVDLLECHDTGISIERFERHLRETGFVVANRRLYLINPIYTYKFNLKPRVLWPLFASIPWIRNFYTTCCYYLVRPTP